MRSSKIPMRLSECWSMEDCAWEHADTEVKGMKGRAHTSGALLKRDAASDVLPLEKPLLCCGPLEALHASRSRLSALIRHRH